MFGQFVNISMCSTCGGTGQLIVEKCDECRGEGRVQGESTVKVTIPAGVRTGNYLTVEGQGHAGRRGGSPGDAQVVIEEIEHDVFERDNDDVIMDLTIDFGTAALGATVNVPTLTGEAEITIDHGTQPGTQLRMKGKGIQHLNARGSGDQIIRVNVYVPESLSAKEKQALKDLTRGDHFQPKDKREKRDLFTRMKEAFSG
jgi:molecular chaperone DnaJ